MQDLYPVTPEWAALRDRLLEREGAKLSKDGNGESVHLDVPTGPIVSWRRYAPSEIDLLLSPWNGDGDSGGRALVSIYHIPTSRYDEAEVALEALREPLMALQAKLNSFEEDDNA